MNPVIDQNNLARKFNFGSLITKSDDAAACEIIKNIIASGNYFANSPKYQTQENIFARSEAVWLKYRMSWCILLWLYSKS
jgi:hypothetical protein